MTEYRVKSSLIFLVALSLINCTHNKEPTFLDSVQGRVNLVRISTERDHQISDPAIIDKLVQACSGGITKDGQYEDLSVSKNEPDSIIFYMVKLHNGNPSEPLQTKLAAIQFDMSHRENYKPAFVELMDKLLQNHQDGAGEAFQDVVSRLSTKKR